VSFATFSYLRNYMWHTVWRWVQRKHPKTGRKELFNPITVGTTRYRYRGLTIPTPWDATG
ncbi:group II intron maturase-specific domain-containing protein, partial [Streptomyces sp. NPDC055400]